MNNFTDEFKKKKKERSKIQFRGLPKAPKMTTASIFCQLWLS